MFKVGDKVRISPYITKGMRASGFMLTPSMAALSGALTTITGVSTSAADPVYTIAADNSLSMWSADWLEAFPQTQSTVALAASQITIPYPTSNPFLATKDFSSRVRGDFTSGPSQSCQHTWKKYMGLNEQFQYCDNNGCKEKRDYDQV